MNRTVAGHAPTAVPPTAVPSTAESATTAPATTPVTEPAGPVVSSTTAAPTAAPPTTAATAVEPEPLGPTERDGGLPVTGSSSSLIAVLGAVIALGGLALVSVGRRARTLD